MSCTEGFTTNGHFSFEDDIIQSSFPFNRKHSSIICNNRLGKVHIVKVSKTTKFLVSAKYHSYIRNTWKILKSGAGEG
jgi:hypothetical protein